MTPDMLSSPRTHAKSKNPEPRAKGSALSHVAEAKKMKEGSRGETGDVSQGGEKGKCEMKCEGFRFHAHLELVG